MTELERLTALEEIRKLKARYFRALDTKDWTALRALFLPDALLDVRDDVASGGVIEGSEEIARAISSVLADVVSVHHGHTPEIELTSDTTATGIWPMEDLLRWPEDSDSPVRELRGYGHYHEQYELRDGQWKFRSVALRRLRIDRVRRSKAG